MAAKTSGNGAVFLTLFFFSGATALVYEVVWSKFLSQMFGSTIQAQTVVLAVFMGGLALGNWWLGKLSEKLQNPVRLYGVIEILIGVYAFATPILYRLADAFFVQLGSKMLEQEILLLALKGVWSVLLLLGPTILMGGTLPLLARWLQSHYSDANRCSARFYSVNSLGAVFGAGMAGFYLVRELGMVSALQMTALVNVLIGCIAFLLGTTTTSTADLVACGNQPTGDTNKLALRWSVLLAALTGGVSMGLEVLASRSLSLIFGASLQSFAIVLMAFILGIGLGSAVVASPRWRRLQSVKMIVLLLLAAGMWLGLLVYNVEIWVDLYRLGRIGLARTTMGYNFHQLFAGGLSMLILGLPAGLIGSVLPLLIRTISGGTHGLGREVGRLLTWNTLGAVVGVLVTGFVLMPLAGLRAAFCILALGLGLAAFITAFFHRMPRGLGAAAGVMAMLGLLWGTGGDGWRHVMSSGVFRARETQLDTSVMDARKKHIQILFYEDAADATVSVERGDGIGASPSMGLRINGKADASTEGDVCTQLLVGHLPMLAKPDSKDVFILGLGCGMTAGALTGHPLERLVVAENCEPVIRAAQLFEPWNYGVLTNPLVKIWREDARTVLKLSPQKYDVIITQPSNPWMAGVGSVFSREFYELASSRLKPGGIVSQWFHLYDMHDGIVGLVLRTFSTVFPYVEIWDCGSGDIVLLGAHQPWANTPGIFERVWKRAGPRKDLERIGIHSQAALMARQLASQDTAFAIAGDGPIQSDWFPVLEYEAPRAFYLGVACTMLAEYDERTRQMAIAPSEKRDALNHLSGQDLFAVFGRYWTVNQEYGLEVRKRFPEATLNSARQEGGPTVDHARELLERGPQQSIEGVGIVEASLRQMPPSSNADTAELSILAIKNCLLRGDLSRARALLRLGLQNHPRHAQLRYIEKVLERKAAQPYDKPPEFSLLPGS